ncbi:hypothetical protein J2X68_007457 [Streptomyces sp. 3330]|nr:hypothetical protein [Streptomyces sp. 3330]
MADDVTDRDAEADVGQSTMSYQSPHTLSDLVAGRQRTAMS